MCIATTLQDKIDPASWYLRKQGWAGATNPANILSSRIEGATFGGSGKTDTEKRAVRMGIADRDARHAASGVSAQAPGHVQAIAQRKAAKG